MPISLSACKGTIKREKNQIYLGFSESEYLRPQAKVTIKREKNQIYLSLQGCSCSYSTKQIIQSDLLVYIIGTGVCGNAVCGNHNQLYGMCLCMLLAI